MKRFITIKATANVDSLGVGAAPYMGEKEATINVDAILGIRQSQQGIWNIVLKPEYVSGVKEALGIDSRLEIKSIWIGNKVKEEL